MIDRSYIAMTNCVVGHLYRLRSRNLVIGVYDGRGFIGIREKFGHKFLFMEYHWDQGAPYGTVHPIEDVGVLPEGIPVRVDLGCACKVTNKPVEYRTDLGYFYIGTDEKIPEYPASWAVTVPNKELFNYLQPLNEVELTLRHEKRLIEVYDAYLNDIADRTDLTPLDLARTADKRGWGSIGSIWILKHHFKLSIAEAKELTDKLCREHGLQMINQLGSGRSRR